MSNEYIIQKYGLDINTKRFGRLDIPNTDRGDLCHLFNELGYKVGAEIGVERGRFSEQICLANPLIELYGVDHYGNYGGKFGKNQEANYAEAQERLKQYDFRFVKKTSMEALSEFADGSLDFVYIDGDHEFSHVACDIVEWTKKIRKGGIVSGHDYSHPQNRWDGNGELKKNVTHHVKEAVDGYMAGYRIEPWFVLGRTERRDGEKRELLRSWFFVKV